MSDPFIRNLSRDFTAVKRPVRPGTVACAWLLGSTAYVLVATAMLGPFRHGFFDQLVTTPRYLLEMIMGIAAVASFTVVAFREAVPGYDTRALHRLAWVLTLGWLSQFLVGFQFPVLESSMVGKRAHCALEAYLYSVPPVLVALWLQRRRYPLRPLRAALNAALASGMIGALSMQIACMYEPAHILKFHLFPIVVLSAAVGALFYAGQTGRSR